MNSAEDPREGLPRRCAPLDVVDAKQHETLLSEPARARPEEDTCMKRVKRSTSTTTNVLGLDQAGQHGLSVHRDPRPGDIMRMSRKMVEQVKLDRRLTVRGRRGVNLIQDEVVPLYAPDTGWPPVLGQLSMHDAALVVSVPFARGLTCCVMTRDGRLLALRNASYDDGSVEFLGRR